MVVLQEWDAMIDTASCPSCQRVLRVPADLMGQAVKCPACGTTFTASSGGPPPRAAVAAPPPGDEKPTPYRVQDREDDDEDYDDRPRRPRRDEDYDDRPRRYARDDDYDDDYDDRPRRRRRYQEHRGGVILALGICSFFFVPIILGPIAWIMGSNDLKEIRAGRMDPEGESNTSVGRVLGMISTILYGLIIIGCLGFACLGAIIENAR
jgi:predicted Zn finger-like uncharacterized protein